MKLLLSFIFSACVYAQTQAGDLVVKNTIDVQGLTAGRCIQRNAAGTAFESSAGPCGVSSGSVTGPGTATVDNEVALWNGTSGTVLKRSTSTFGLIKIVSGIITSATGADFPASGVIANTYGAQATVPQITVDVTGRITAANSTSIVLDAAAIQSGTHSIARGGTGATSFTGSRCIESNSAGTALVVAAGACGSGPGGGVSSVSWNGGIVTVATPTSTPAFTIAGTSGGIPYFNSPTQWTTSAALTLNAPVIGGGTGGSPGSGTVQGNTTKFVSYAGTAPSTDHCAKFDSGGNLTTSGGACGGSGSVSGPGAITTSGYFPQWTSTSGTSLGVGLVGASTTATASSVMLRDTLGASVSYDKGGQVYNVKAYGATGNGSTDDRVAIQNAIDACQTSTNGGTVFLPAGLYVVTRNGANNFALSMGNGSGNVHDTLKPCHILGAGTASPGNRNTGSTIFWSGAGSSAYWVMHVKGPRIGGGFSNIVFDGNDVVNGIWLDHVAHSNSYGLLVSHALLGMRIKARMTDAFSSYGACDNTFTHFRVDSNPTGGSGLDLDGLDVAGGLDACSNTFYASFIVRDANTAGTYDVRLGFADNNRFIGGNFYGFPTNNPGGGSSILYVNQTVNTQFPHENTFVSISPHHGVSGTAGGGNPNIYIDYHTGDCWSAFSNCDPYAIGGTKPIVQSTSRELLGVSEVRHVSGSASQVWESMYDTAGTLLARLSRSGNGLDVYSFDNVIINAPGGTQVSAPRTWFQLGSSSSNGTLIYCSDCQILSVCSPGGSGSFAKRINGNWICN